MSTPLTLEQMQSFITFINNAFAKRPYTLNPAVDFNQGMVLVATGLGLGTEPMDIATILPPPVVPWEPNTDFFANPDTGAQVLVHHGDSLYLADPMCSTGPNFTEFDGLKRISLDTDLEYLEITADATTPITANQIIGRYLGIRRFTVRDVYTLPNDNLSYPMQYNKAVCNGSITTPTVVTLERLESNATYTAVGTITFTPDADPQYTLGVFAFNDAYMEGHESEGMIFGDDAVLVMRVTTVGAGLEWLSINLLAEFMRYTDPRYNPPV